MKIYKETERLQLREIHPTDVEGILKLDTDPEVHRYLGNSPIKTKEEALAAIQYIRQQYQDNGIGRWAVINKSTNEFIGWSGLKLIKEKTNNHINYYDLGYRFQQEHWGKGYATETAIASLDYAFNNLNINEVHAIVDCENKGSNNVLQKVGLQYIETFDLDGTPHNWYTITKTHYNNLKF